MEVNESFGGMNVTLTCDFKQILPIVWRVNQMRLVRAYINGYNDILHLFKDDAYTLTTHLRLEIGACDKEIENMREFVDPGWCSGYPSSLWCQTLMNDAGGG